MPVALPQVLNLLRPVTEDREDEGGEDSEEEEEQGHERLEAARTDSVSSSSHNELSGRGRSAMAGGGAEED